MLENLVPLEVHNAMVDYEAKKGGLVQAEVGRMREATQLMNGYCADESEDLSFDCHVNE